MISKSCFSQTISGNWAWEYDNGKHITEITLENINSNTLQGNYCSTFYSGSKIDCNENLNDFCIQVSSTSTNVFEGTFKSSFCEELGILRLTYNPAEDQLFLEILNEPDGEYYLPDDVIFNR